MTARMLALSVLALVTAACEIGSRPAGVVIAGPTVPSPFPTLPPYVWDSADELSIWVNNPVAFGSLVLEGTGAEAFIRIDRADRDWLLRGPDLQPTAEGVKTVSIRYRWRPDPGLPATASFTARVSAHFQTSTPVTSDDPTAQAHLSSNLSPSDNWTEVTMLPQGPFKPPIGVEYCYLHSFGANRGVLEIDRIELVR